MQEMKRKHQGNWNSVDKKAHRRAYGSRKTLGNVFSMPIPLYFLVKSPFPGTRIDYNSKQIMVVAERFGLIRTHYGLIEMIHCETV